MKQTLYNGRSTYPAVDVFAEIAKMESWLDANPKKRKTQAGIKRFINSWLARAQDRGVALRRLKAIRQKSVRDRSNLDELTDISWLEGAVKERMRQYFTNKYGQAYDA